MATFPATGPGAELTGQRRIRACIAILHYPPEFGGHGVQIQRSLPYLEREGIDATILTQRLEGPAGATTGDPRVARVLSRHRSRLDVVRRVLEMRRFLRHNRARIDVFHSVLQGWELLGNLGYARRLGLPTVYEMIILDGDDPAAIGRSRAGGLKLRLMKDVDAWLGLSEVFRSRVRVAGIPEDRFLAVPGGVETARYRVRDPAERRVLRGRLGLPEEARIAVSVGAVIRRKGMDRLLAAWRALGPREGRDLLLIVGPDSAADRVDPAFVEGIRREAEGPELKGTVRLVGRVDNVEEYLGASDVFVFLSRKEGLGYVTLEAMASGLPCIVSPLDGISAGIVEEGRTGHIVEDADDAAAVAPRIQALLGDPERRAAFGRAGRRVVEERFSMEVRARALRRLYEDLLERAPRRAEG